MTLDKNKEDKQAAQPDTKPPESPLKTFLQYSAISLALITALLALLGWTYGTSYLAAWHLPERLFPLIREETVFGGFYQVLFVIAKNLSLVTYLLYLLLLVMVATMITCYRPFVGWLNNRLVNLFKPLQGRVEITEAHDGIMDTLSFVASGVGVSFVCFIGVAFLLFWTDGQAKAKVDKERKAILTNGSGKPPRARLYVRNESKVFEIYSGYMINVSATHAALYSKDKGMVILPMSSIARVEVEEQDRKEK